MKKSQLVAPLFDGPLDVVGDVHGEIRPLRELLNRLGYDTGGLHPGGRRLVFVGDLGDRGPDSPAVIELVRSLVERGRAQCLLGNHELNLLRGESKPGNRWFIDPAHAEMQPDGEFAQCRRAPQALKPKWLKFFASLPLVLERSDLRVVHAAWVAGEIEALRRTRGTISEVYQHFESRTARQLEMAGLLAAAAVEHSRWERHLADSHAQVPLLTAIGEVDERHQMGNPVRVVTSGVERLAAQTFWSGGKWRMCQRVRWWAEYVEPEPVIIGHYWRQARPVAASAQAVSKPEMFDDVGPTEWVGRRNNVFCVDFSIGARCQERKKGVVEFNSHLAAMRWPEKELWFENGQARV